MRVTVDISRARVSQSLAIDPDDVMFLLYAINGPGSHLVSYDNHLRSLRSFYERELKICEPLEFLVECRAVSPG
jgi:predicted nucleic acid-binding protein